MNNALSSTLFEPTAKMADVEFGDSELFEQLDDARPVPTHIRFMDDEEGAEDPSRVKEREEYQEKMQTLINENQRLKTKLSILTRPSYIKIEDVDVDGPILQILYTNNSISKQCRQEIEDCICDVIQKYRRQGNLKNNLSIQMKPQNSAFAMEEAEKATCSCGIKDVTNAFTVVGSVLYFTSFCVDKLGQPLLNDNPQLTEGWEVPTYQQGFSQVIGAEDQEMEMTEKRPKSVCFNCGSSTHQLKDCPQPKDMASINKRRKEFSQNNNQAILGNRYHADEVEERFAKFKPGVMRQELLTALGVGANTLPPLIYRMRQLGYPPGWLKEAELENSGLTLYDGKVSNDGGGLDTGKEKPSFDVSKLVDFPGFNVPAPSKMKDEYMQYGSIPMQYNHMKQNFAAYLSNSFPEPGATCNKRRHESDSTPQQRKKRRSSPDRSTYMDIDSDPGTHNHFQESSGFQFQPPLAPGSPSFCSPPPLPQGTPPATPTPPPLPKGTPPPTPTNGSPALQGHTWGMVEEVGEGMEDGLTLEELEEQQRLIWAALENADTATNSDCETPAMGTPVPSSSSVSTPAHVDTEMETEDHEAEGVVCSSGSVETISQISEKQWRTEDEKDRPESPGPAKAWEDSPQSSGPIKVQEDSPLNPVPIKAEEDSPQSPGPIEAEEDSPRSLGPIKAEEDSPLSPGPIKAEEDSPQSPGPNKAEEDDPLNPGPIKAEEDSSQSPGPNKAEEDGPQNPGRNKAEEDGPQNPGPNKAEEESPQSPGPIKSQEDISQSPGPIKVQEDCPETPDAETSTQEDADSNSLQSVVAVTAVPHRSRFAAGIVPFEDTPEFTEVSVPTGTYLRIRDLLKSSPRNVAKKEKRLLD
ncbi:zinc finger CCHC domain-containing protein 8 isoform X1 [Lampris incognitus]|uniref:zinc finger CCHC domain-containing protein 8 isoform X1 n=1 Tax=Lampris incognitus TaxID=2546036 RepID=UPI0024B62C2D|nr:zinc finger CCHC domain-containing protein 8 isoform X1 [Lampris incognitus]